MHASQYWRWRRRYLRRCQLCQRGRITLQPTPDASRRDPAGAAVSSRPRPQVAGGGEAGAATRRLPMLRAKWDGAVMNVKYPCNKKCVCRCIPIAIALQTDAEGFKCACINQVYTRFRIGI